MSCRLIVMRHAKSSWDTDAPDDHSRPLNKRGRADAPRIAQRLAEISWMPQWVLSSDSTRTRETLGLMLDAWDPQPIFDFFPSFYHAGVHEIQIELRTLTDDVQTAMVLGHNPGWQHAVHWLSGEFVSMTTANAALLTIEAENWAAAGTRQREWKLEDVLRPKEL